ncbi:nitrate- and nitrite sensing domain-containing protein [Thauera sp. WH-1]|uniref:nitrate- and nitrite sensing domain-containing protein n=1 Tax=Thauera sp. WH-1 TaxID=3398230 RepID=UPI0039FD44CD
MTSALSFLVAARRCEIDELEQLARTCELVQELSELVHRLQRERGACNVHLASAGQRFGAELDERIAASAAAEVGVRDWLDGLEQREGALAGGVRLFTRIAVAVHALDQLPALREAVRAQACSAQEATRRYNRAVAALLALVFEAADVAVDPAVSRPLVGLFNLMQGKEFAGQERAAGAAAFAAGRIGSEEMQQLVHLIESQEQCFERFEAFCADEVLTQWRALQATMPLSELERLRRKLVAAAPAAALDGALADVWFDCCSQRLDQIHEVEAHLATSLQQACERKIAATRAELEDQQAMLEALRAQPDAPAPLTVLVGGDPAAPGGEAGWEGGEGVLRGGDGLGPRLTRSILDTLQAQSRRLQAMGDELATVRATLDERKLIERAKGLLMAHQGLSEEEAYRLLRQTAMNQGRRLVDVAQAVLAMAELLPGAVVKRP